MPSLSPACPVALQRAGLTLLVLFLRDHHPLLLDVSCILSNLLSCFRREGKSMPWIGSSPKMLLCLGERQKFILFKLENFMRASGALGYAKPSCLSSGQEKGCFLKRLKGIPTEPQGNWASLGDAGDSAFLSSPWLSSLHWTYYFTFLWQGRFCSLLFWNNISQLSWNSEAFFFFSLNLVPT